MKKKQKINKAVNRWEWILLGLTALFLCVLFLLRERPAPARGIAVRTASSYVPDAATAAPESSAAPDSNAPDDAPSDAAAPASDGGDASGLVNINTADLAQLCALPGVGEALAGRIVAYREEFGPFARPEDVMRVSGIGQGKFSAMKGLITV